MAQPSITSSQHSSIRTARWDVPRDVAEIQALLREFHALLVSDYGFDACMLLEDAEALPGPYCDPHGCFLLAEVNGQIAGGFAVRPCEGSPAGIAEAKRMFIRPQYRGLGLGHTLVAAVLMDARARGYNAIRLDSLRELTNAHRLYEKHGFRLIAPYNSLPPERVLHMECAL
jgi:putative acetyltransferase